VSLFDDSVAFGDRLQFADMEFFAAARILSVWYDAQ